ncbi:MAG: RES domain-containing protein [Nitrococcus sp.]|nr:RES domain-containing protein [Nitrococcus sp.]
MTLTLWRIGKAKYEQSHWTGEGALKAAGRWTHPGIPVVYTAQSQALVQLECLAHFPRPRLASLRLVIAPAEVPEAVSRSQLVRHDLPDDWRRTLDPPRALRDLGTAWLVAAETALLCVPSVLSETDCNYLINPVHPDARLIQFGKPRPFGFDRRLSG